MYYLKQLIDKECEPQHLVIPLPIHPTHIAVNCNQEWLAIISGPLLLVYKCLGFQNQVLCHILNMYNLKTLVRIEFCSKHY